MDPICPTPDAIALDELLAVQAVLAGLTVVLDEVERSMPPIVCTWRGTAREAYGANLMQLSAQFCSIVESIRDARAAISSALSAAS